MTVINFPNKGLPFTGDILEYATLLQLAQQHQVGVTTVERDTDGVNVIFAWFRDSEGFINLYQKGMTAQSEHLFFYTHAVQDNDGADRELAEQHILGFMNLNTESGTWFIDAIDDGETAA